MNKLGLAKKLQERTKAFAISTINLSRTLPNSRETNVISYQIIKSGTSAAANYRAACRTCSRKEFVARIGIVVEEADEAIFWLKVLKDIQLVKTDFIEPLIAEGEEILAIIMKSK